MHPSQCRTVSGNITKFVVQSGVEQGNDDEPKGK